MEKEVLDQITLKLGIITGFIFLAIITPLRIYWRKNALNKIKSSLIEGEEIVYILELPFSTSYFFPYCVGAFWGSFILPFWIFNDINNVGMVNKTSLIYFFSAEILCFCAIIFLFSIVIVITNNRIKKLSNFSFLNKIIQKLDMPISEIESINYQKHFAVDELNILTKNNKLYSFSGVNDLKKIYEYLNNLIKIGD